jgi:hypothetical protein
MNIFHRKSLDKSDCHIYCKIIDRIIYRRKEQICIMSFYNDCITKNKRINIIFYLKREIKKRKLRINTNKDHVD